MRKIVITIGFASSLLFGLTQVAKAELTAKEVSDLVSACTSLPAQYRACNAQIREHEVTVKLTRGPSETEQDCRINAVLLAKAIMEKSSDVEVVFVWFHVTPEKWWIFEPNRSTVSFYAMGNMSNEQLMKNLPLNVHMDVQSIDDLLKSSAGPGPYREERLLLLTWIRHHSGRDDAASGVYSPLPSIDSYSQRLEAIELKARRQSSKTVDVELLKEIEALKRDLNLAATAFSRLPEKERNRQIVAYMQKHHLKMQNWTGRPDSRTPVTTGSVRSSKDGTAASSGDVVQIKREDFQRLSPKYPQYIPVSSCGKFLARRQIAATYIMLMAENRTLQPDIATKFAMVEEAAKSNNEAGLAMLLSSLEKSLGLNPLAMQSK